MKKIISIFSLFIFSICFLKTHADSFMFKWEENTTFIDVPLKLFGYSEGFSLSE